MPKQVIHTAMVTRRRATIRQILKVNVENVLPNVSL